MSEVLSPPELPPQYHIISAASHPQILDKWWPESRKLYPRWLTGSVNTGGFEQRMVRHTALAPFLLYVVTGVEDVQSLHTLSEETWVSVEVVAKCSSIPFYWAALDESGVELEKALQSLPDDGWVAIFRLGLSQVKDGTPDAHKRPNVLGGLEVAVLPDYRKDNLAEILIGRTKALAKLNDIKVLAVPVRPTLKHKYPGISMQEYIQWPGPDQGEAHPSLPFDPWLRKHCHLGAKILKVCPKSAVFKWDMTEWEDRTGVDLQNIIRNRSNPDGSDELLGDYFDIEIPFALGPLRCYPASQKGVVVEPNVWVYHQVD